VNEKWIKAKTNQEVIEAWLQGYQSQTGNLASDGRMLRSYGVPIARLVNGIVFLAPEMKRFWSKSTSRHLGLVKATAKARGMIIRWQKGE